MFKFLIITLAFVVTTVAVSYNYIQHANETCYSEKDFFKRINDEKLVTLVKSETDPQHFLEIMITPYADKEVVVVEYEKQLDSKEVVDNKYCVKTVGIKSNINKDIIEELYQALEKLKGTRA